MATPPVVVGELSDVPAPQSPVASNWANEVSNRIIHRFATSALLGLWTTALEGTHAVDVGSGTRYVRLRNQWVPLDVAIIAALNGGPLTVSTQPALWLPGAQPVLPAGNWLVGVYVDVSATSGWSEFTLAAAAYPTGTPAGQVLIDGHVFELPSAVLNRFGASWLFSIDSPNLGSSSQIGFIAHTGNGTVQVNSSRVNATRIGPPRPGTYTAFADDDDPAAKPAEQVDE
jgi:hypothetical protein